MNILIIGGTRFVGRHIADALIARGHAVTLFNRGTNRTVHADVEQVHGDRAYDLARLGQRTWDAVVDTSGYTPDIVQTSSAYFHQRAGWYVFVSTISVYDHTRTQGPDEDAALLEFPQERDSSQFNEELYGALKALCERRVQNVWGRRSTILRPGLVAGPFDHTDRFTYWPVRFDDGGEVLMPPSESQIQYIDARDLAAFAVAAIEQRITGVFNCVTSQRSLTFGDLAQACMHEAAPEDALAVHVSEEFLAAHNVRPWSELPLWIPAASELASIANADSSRAQAAGLQVRPLRETVRDTLAWARCAEKRPGALQAGLEPDREAELINAARRSGQRAVK